jgi:Tol biopolymer transport system component
VRIALVLIGLFLVFAGIATATYLATRTSSGAPPTPRNGRLTIIGGEGISEVDRGGRLRTVWRCRRPTNCGILTSVAWAPNGRQLAFTMAQFNRPASGRGLHILDTRTGETDVVPTDRLGCRDPRDLAWSPDGSRLAYACPSAVVLIHADGSDRRVLARRGGGYSSPSWSPDGTRVVFAVRRGSQRVGSSSIYVVNIYGSHERLLAARATAPAWSPDGKRIAFRTGCGGIKLITPTGRDVTPFQAFLPRCHAIGLPGIPVWSPDGRKLAIATHRVQATRGGIYTMDPDGSHLQLVTTSDWRGPFGLGRPSWRPAFGASETGPHEETARCEGCP